MKLSDRKRLEDRAYLRENLMMADRLERQRTEGSNYEPLILEGYEFDHEWVGLHTAQLYNRDRLAWQLVEDVTGGSFTLEDHHRPRIYPGQGSSDMTDETGSDTEDDDTFVVDDEDVEDDYGPQDPPTASDDSDGLSGNEGPGGDPYDSGNF